MDSEVTLAHITEAYAARVSADDKYKRDQEHDERTEFQLIFNSLSPELYDVQLERLLQRCSVQAGEWLERDRRFSEWQDPSNQSARTLWLAGIPGAGIQNHRIDSANEEALIELRQNIPIIHNCKQTAEHN